jgi:hypothetical protein
VFPTAEVRWFWQGDVPHAALDWLDTRPGGAPTEETRTDHYLIVSTTDTLGIKLREGQIEIKQRTGPARPTHLSDQAYGLTESWTKWSFGLARERPVLNQVIASGAWTGIKKTRWLKEYRITETGSAEFLGPGENAKEVCALEIAQVTVLDAHAQSRWWTLGLEASGDEKQLTRTLHRTATDLLSLPLPRAMREENSSSYPKWLRRLHALELIP